MNELHPLGKLIQATQDREGWSTRDMERIAERQGYSMKHSNFSRLKIEPVVAIKASQIQILASVLRVSEQTVAIAALASMGVELESQWPSLADALRQTTELHDRDQRLVVALVSAMRNDEGENNADQDNPQTNPPGPRTLRAVGSSGEALAGQKTRLEDASIPPREQLAAHPNVRLHRDKWDEAYGDLGEESQDPDASI